MKKLYSVILSLVFMLSLVSCAFSTGTDDIVSSSEIETNPTDASTSENSQTDAELFENETIEHSNENPPQAEDTKKEEQEIDLSVENKVLGTWIFDAFSVEGYATDILDHVDMLELTFFEDGTVRAFSMPTYNHYFDSYDENFGEYVVDEFGDVLIDFSDGLNYRLILDTSLNRAYLINDEYVFSLDGYNTNFADEFYLNGPLNNVRGYYKTTHTVFDDNHYMSDENGNYEVDLIYEFLNIGENSYIKCRVGGFYYNENEMPLISNGLEDFQTPYIISISSITYLSDNSYKLEVKGVDGENGVLDLVLNNKNLILDGVELTYVGANMRDVFINTYGADALNGFIYSDYFYQNVFYYGDDILVNYCYSDDGTRVLELFTDETFGYVHNGINFSGTYYFYDNLLKLIPYDINRDNITFEVTDTALVLVSGAIEGLTAGEMLNIGY